MSVAFVCVCLCVVSHVMCVRVCVSTGNMIGVEGVKALRQCLFRLTQLTQLNLSGECCICVCVYVCVCVYGYI